MSAEGSDFWMQAITLGAATLISEDLACVAAGLLIRGQQLGALAGILACTTGIFIGDLGLWLIGRVFGRRVLTWTWVRKRLPAERVDALATWFDERGWRAVISARFVPGLRLPVYVAAGIVGRRIDRFLLWAAMAVLLWTPLLVLLVAAFGTAILTPLERLLGAGWWSWATAVLALGFAIQLAVRSSTKSGRSRMYARVSRIWRWEFWPAWLFYLPLLPWLAYLAIRYRGITTPTSANPMIPHGGVVGESKSEILAKLPGEWTLANALLPPGAPIDRVGELERAIAAAGWNYPLILKPDAGQRGVGLKLVEDSDAAAHYLDEHPQAVIAQVFHAGPYEAGIFYYRYPGESHGHIFSITDKTFPVVIGDGVSTIESLIWGHERYAMQAETFLARLGENSTRVPAWGERVPLAISGNHCQGAQFRDGAHLITPALEARIDEIAQSVDGFYFGRFDVRYGDVGAFRAGNDLAIIELNGVTSESTNLYDPSRSLFAAYRILFHQWRILFQIGYENRQRGHASSSIFQLIADSLAYYRNRRVTLLAD